MKVDLSAVSAYYLSIEDMSQMESQPAFADSGGANYSY